MLEAAAIERTVFTFFFLNPSSDISLSFPRFVENIVAYGVALELSKVPLTGLGIILLYPPKLVADTG
jgi:hypothetical protein